MNMSVQNIYQTKLAQIQQRIPANVKTNFSSVLNNAVQNTTENKEVAQVATSSNDNDELLKSLSQMMYTNTLMGNGSSSLLSSSSSNGLSLPTYNTNTALSLALSKMMKSE